MNIITYPFKVIASLIETAYTAIQAKIGPFTHKIRFPGTDDLKGLKPTFSAKTEFSPEFEKRFIQKLGNEQVSEKERTLIHALIKFSEENKIES